MLTPDETQRIQNKLDLNEQLLWCGKPIPRAFTKTTLCTMLFGIPWCAISGTIATLFISQMWFSDPNSAVTVNGVKTTVSEVSIWFKIAISAFFIPFIAIGIATLFSPLWKYLSMTGQIYLVTTKRAACFGRFFRKSWRAPEIEFIDRADRRNATGDIHFTYTASSRNGVHAPIGFDNLPAHDLDAAEAALRALTKTLQS